MQPVYKSLITGSLMALLIERESGVDTFIEVDSKGFPVLKKRAWAVNAKPIEQHYLIKKPYEGKIQLIK